MSDTKINSKMIEAGELTSTQLNINDGNTTINNDGSGNLQFTDAVTGSKTLADLAANPEITLSGDVSGSGTTSLNVTVADDSHSHTSSTVTLASTDLADTASIARLNAAAFTSDITVPDEAYGSQWDGSLEVPTKNAVYDKIENLSGSTPVSKSFTATNGQTNFTLNSTPSAAWVWYNGLLQDAAAWSISGDDIVLTFGAGTGAVVRVYYVTAIGAISSHSFNDLTDTAGAIGYTQVASTLRGKITDNDGAWDFSAAGIIEASVSSNTTVSFSNLELNKTLKVKLDISNSATITFPSYCKVLEGSVDPSGTDGTYYAYFDCWESANGSESVLMSTVQEEV